MRLIIKILFFILMGFLFSLEPLLAEQRISEFSPKVFEEMQVIIDDFLVNDDTTGGCAQTQPAIARCPSGNFVIVWEDYRDAYSGIYAQRYDSTGTPIGSNFRVYDDVEPRIYYYPAIAMDNSGNFVITWHQGGVVYARRYNALGEPLSPSFEVSSGAYADVGMDSSSNFIITWQGGSADIYAQRYYSSGIPVGEKFKVNDDPVIGYVQGLPVIVIDCFGNFIIAWQDSRNDIHENNFDIYAQRYISSGIPQGSNFKVNDDVGTKPQYFPAITADGSGNFLITWYDRRNDNHDIYAQRYDSSGTPQGSNFEVNDDVGDWAQQYPAVDMDSSGNFIITWMDGRSGWHKYDIYAQRFNSSGIPQGSNFKVNDDVGDADQNYPAIAMDRSGNFLIVFNDPRDADSDIFAQKYNSVGTTVGSNFRVNNDSGTTSQSNPAIAMDASGSLVIAWNDHRNNNYDIYAQRFNSSHATIGSNFRVNDDTGVTSQSNPAVDMDSSGNFIITWMDGRNEPNKYDIYAQRFNSSGVPQGSNFRVNDETLYTNSYFPAVYMDNSGDFVITWCDDYKKMNYPYSYLYHIRAQRFDSSGTPLGSKLQVDDDDGSYFKAYPAVAGNNSGDFVITWHSDSETSTDIFAQRYSSSGIPLDSNFKVNDVNTRRSIFPSIAMNQSGNFVITWEDPRDGSANIFAQQYDSSGTAVGSNFRVNDDVGIAYQTYPAVAMDDSGNFIITWYDYRNENNDIYAQRYDPSGNPLGNNYQVPNSKYTSFAQQYPVVGISSSNICFAWQDNRRARSWDIYAKVVDWSWTKVEEEVVGLPNAFELAQNYPNPFNPITNIFFRAGSSVHGAGSPIHTTLTIYNILGQKVRTLLDEEKLPGNHRIIWGGKDDSGKKVASGVYLYQLRAKDYTETKKMVLLR